MSEETTRRSKKNSREGLFEGRVRELNDARNATRLVGGEDGLVAEGSDGSCGEIVRNEEACRCSVPVAAARELRYEKREGRRRGRGEGSETRSQFKPDEEPSTLLLCSRFNQLEEWIQYNFSLKKERPAHHVLNPNPLRIREPRPTDCKLVSLAERVEPDDRSNNGRCDDISYDCPVEEDEKRVVVGRLEDGRDGEEGGEDEEDSESETGCEKGKGRRKVSFCLNPSQGDSIVQSSGIQRA